MRVFTSLTLYLALSAMLTPALAVEDFVFITGTYAMDTDDCKAAASGKAFSEELVETLTDDVMTPAFTALSRKSSSYARSERS